MFFSKHLAWSKVCECILLPARVGGRLISLPIPSLTSKGEWLIFIEHNPFYGWHCDGRVEALHEILWDGVLPDKKFVRAQFFFVPHLVIQSEQYY